MPNQRQQQTGASSILEEMPNAMRDPYANTGYAAPIAISYIAGSIQRGKAEKMQRAQQVKSYLATQGWSDEALIANENTRKIYLEAMGIDSTEPVGKRRMFGILPRKQELVSPERATQLAPPKNMADIFSESPYAAERLQKTSPEMASSMLGQEGVRDLVTPKYEIMGEVAEARKEAARATLKQLSNKNIDELNKLAESTRKEKEGIDSKYGNMMDRWIATNVTGLTDEQRADMERYKLLNDVLGYVRQAQVIRQLGINVEGLAPKKGDVKSAADEIFK